MAYGFSCGYCEDFLETPFNDAKEAHRYAHDQGWRLTYGKTRTGGDGAQNTCSNCLLPSEHIIPMYVE